MRVETKRGNSNLKERIATLIKITAQKDVSVAIRIRKSFDASGTKL